MIVFVGADAGPRREARIRHYQARAEEGLPLFEDGDPHGERRGQRRCIACGTVAPMMRRAQLPDGWKCQSVTKDEDECHCPECFARWGWGDDLAVLAERAAAGVGLWHPKDNNMGRAEG